MVRTTILTTCLSILYITSMLCSDSSTCAKLLCCKKTGKQTAQPLNSDNDNDITDGKNAALQAPIAALHTTEQASLKKLRLKVCQHDIENCCICSLFVVSCIAICGCLTPPICGMMDDYCKDSKRRREQDIAKITGAPAPQQTMQE
jgi:hypothetical protein